MSEVPALDAARGQLSALTTGIRTTLPKEAAARRVIAALLRRGVDTFFGIPGGPACGLFEAIRVTPAARLIASRHESHAGFAAATYYRATGRVPALVVTSGPGITNAVNGIASASLERIPMLVLAGDVAWTTQGRCLAQNSGPEGLHAEQLLRSVTRAQIRVAHSRSAVTQTLAALDVALHPRNPGPALVVLPIDVSMAPCPMIELPLVEPEPLPEPPLHAVHTTARWLAEAQHPLLVLGAGARRCAGAMQALVDTLGIPFVTTPSAKGLISELHPYSLRNAGMAASLWARRYTEQPVDVALVLGTDLDDTSTGTTRYIAPDGRLIHVDLNAAVFGRNLPTALGVTADIAAFARALSAHMQHDPRAGRFAPLVAELHAQSPFDVPGASEDPALPIAPHRALLDLERAAGPSARFITDIGEHMLFALHYLTAREAGQFTIQLALGSMGSGLAGAIGLALADRDCPVVCVVGDGGMQMSGGELLLARKERLPIVFAVWNDGRYGMVHHGMKQIFGAADEWDMPPVDYVMMAAAMDIAAMRVDAPGQITAARLEGLLASGGPVVLDVRIDKTTRVRGGGRVEALQHMSMLRTADPAH